MIKGIIFDLDGTTIYTIEDLTDAVNLTLKEFNFPQKSEDEVRMGIGNGFRKLIKTIVPEGTDEKTETAVGDRYRQIYSQVFKNKSHAYEGMPELMKELTNRGIKIAVNSNKGDNLTKPLIYENYPDVDFVAVFGARDGIKHKPDPTTANEIAKMMNLDNSEIAYVGDSDVDMKTAKNANMTGIGCLWGYRDLNTLQEAGADYIVSKPEEILRCLDE